METTKLSRKQKSELNKQKFAERRALREKTIMEKQAEADFYSKSSEVAKQQLNKIQFWDENRKTWCEANKIPKCKILGINMSIVHQAWERFLCCTFTLDKTTSIPITALELWFKHFNKDEKFKDLNNIINQNNKEDVERSYTLHPFYTCKDKRNSEQIVSFLNLKLYSPFENLKVRSVLDIIILYILNNPAFAKSFGLDPFNLDPKKFEENQSKIFEILYTYCNPIFFFLPCSTEEEAKQAIESLPSLKLKQDEDNCLILIFNEKK
jgi:hypothetical protein